MILLKDLLYEMSSQNLLIPRRVEGRIQKYIESKIKQYKKNNNVGDFDISGLGLTELPASLKQLEIGGSFNCSDNNLDKLTNAPTSVKNFYCYNNKLRSLEGGPTSVGGSFLCSNNNLTSLAGAPSSVGLEFMCNNNKLKSLVGAPTSVGRDFYCYNRGLKFTKEQVRVVCDVKGNIFV